MKRFRSLLASVLCAVLLCSLVTSSLAQTTRKQVKIRGYITQLNSPTSFEIEDYRVKRDESLTLELENQTPEVNFKQSDLRIGTLVEITGEYDEQTSELKATKIKVDLEQFRQLDVTTILDRKPLELAQTDSGWRGLIAADGRRIRIEPETKLVFKLNKSEQKTAQDKQKTEKQKTDKQKTDKQNADQQTTAATEEVVPLKSLDEVGPGTTITYHGREQADGTVLANLVEFQRNELEKGERNLWKQIKVKEKPFVFEEQKPGELKVGGDKYKVVPNKEVQDYVNTLGQSLIPAYQKAMADSDPQKIPFQFRVVQAKGFNAGAYPNGVIIIHSHVFEILENEAQLAAVLAHEIAHATQEHQYRQMQHNKKRRTAMLLGSLAASAFGLYGISTILDIVNTAMVRGYARALENQSDRLCLQYMADAGYDLREAPRVWKLVAKSQGSGPTFYWSSHDNASERRSFMMVTIRNAFSEMDLQALKKNESEFQHVAALVKEATAKKKKAKAS